MTIFGTFVGIYFQQWLVKRSGGSDRYTVLIMAIAVLAILIASSALAILTILQNSALGIDIFKFQAYC